MQTPFHYQTPPKGDHLFKTPQLSQSIARVGTSHKQKVKLFNSQNYAHCFKNSTLFSAFSLSRCIEIGHRQSRPVDECSEEKREGLGREKIHTGRNLMAGERENARGRNTRCCIYTTTLRKIDRMALFIPSYLLLYARGETAENSTLFSAFSLSRCIEIGHRQSLWLKECPKVP